MPLPAAPLTFACWAGVMPHVHGPANSQLSSHQSGRGIPPMAQLVRHAGCICRWCALSPRPPPWKSIRVTRGCRQAVGALVQRGASGAIATPCTAARKAQHHARLRVGCQGVRCLPLPPPLRRPCWGAAAAGEPHPAAPCHAPCHCPRAAQATLGGLGLPESPTQLHTDLHAYIKSAQGVCLRGLLGLLKRAGSQAAAVNCPSPLQSYGPGTFARSHRAAGLPAPPTGTPCAGCGADGVKVDVQGMVSLAGAVSFPRCVFDLLWYCFECSRTAFWQLDGSQAGAPSSKHH